MVESHPIVSPTEVRALIFYNTFYDKVRGPNIPEMADPDFVK